MFCRYDPPRPHTIAQMLCSSHPQSAAGRALQQLKTLHVTLDDLVAANCRPALARCFLVIPAQVTLRCSSYAGCWSNDVRPIRLPRCIIRDECCRRCLGSGSWCKWPPRSARECDTPCRYGEGHRLRKRGDVYDERADALEVL